MNTCPAVVLSGDRMLLSGRVVPDTVLQVRADGERLIKKQGSPLVMVIDLSGVEAAHSVVLSLLLCWVRQAHECQVGLRIEGGDDRLWSLATLSGLDQYLPGIQPSVNASVGSAS